jgi:aspartyl-tRNA synthetase
LPVENDFGRKELDNLIDFSIKEGAKGMAWLRVNKDKLEGNIAKFFNDNLQKKLINKSGIKKGYLLFIADKEKLANKVLSSLRNKLGKDLKLYKKEDISFCWIVDFPLFEWNDDEQKWTPAHHMFTMPKKEYLDCIEEKPGEVIATCYDLVLNGVELGSGSVRIHRKDIQEKIMKVIGLSKEEAEEKFGFLNKAFEYGAPVHGGFAFGFDRFIAILLGLDDIREIIAFPKNKNAQCPMDGSPSEVDEKQLKESNIKLDIVKKK